MSLSASEIAALVAELQPLCGSRVDAVRLHAERTLTLELFGRAGAALLLLSAEPGVTRLHAVERRPPTPPSPLPLQAAMRRELEGRTLEAMVASSGDRVVELRFSGRAAPVRLIAELTGRHGNLFLLDAGGVIRAAFARGTSTQRPLHPGAVWERPAPRPEPEETASRLAPVPGARFALSAAAEARYARLEAELRLAEGRRRLREPLRAAAARARRALEKLAEEADRVPAAEEDRRIADLLKPNLHAIRRGERRAVLVEWTAEGAREVAVALDPALSPRENMERYYRRYRRIAESAARVAARTADVRERLDRVEALSAALAQAGEADLGRIEREARRLGAAPRAAPPTRPSRGREPERLPYRTFRSLTGSVILVGRGPEDNDALTVRVARGNDLWLHARGAGGAHVVVRLDKGKGPDQETLLDAAHLAAWFSQARSAPSADVAWTRARHVRKARGSAPGAVTYSQERTLLLRIEPGRLERLLAAEEPAPS